MIVRVEIRDREFNLLEILDNEIQGLSWEYNRIGGCGTFSFSLPRRYYDEKYISGDFNVRILVRNDATKEYDLWYQGIVEEKIPNVRADETIQVSGHGYQAQLSRIYMDEEYTSTEVSVIVKDILDTYIVPNTDITYDAGDIVATGFTPDTFKFKTSAMEALQTLADTVGSREWGVDKDRKFFFKARSSSVGYRFSLGNKVSGFSSDDSFRDIVNRVIVQGGDIGDPPVPYTKTYDHALSQLKYGIRTDVIQNSSITTDEVSSQFADSILAEFSDVVRKGSCELVDYETRVETTIPIPLFSLISRTTFYGEKLYGTFLYSGEISYQINRINYRMNNDGAVSINLDLGKLRPDLSEVIGQLEYKLEQLRTAGV
jgi:hypothetical protein